MVPVPHVEAVDTTTTGYVFKGALVVAIAEGLALPDAVSFACHAVAVSVTPWVHNRLAPYRNKVELFVNNKMIARQRKLKVASYEYCKLF